VFLVDDSNPLEIVGCSVQQEAQGVAGGGELGAESPVGLKRIGRL